MLPVRTSVTIYGGHKSLIIIKVYEDYIIHSFSFHFEFFYPHSSCLLMSEYSSIHTRVWPNGTLLYRYVIRHCLVIVSSYTERGQLSLY